ncbi:Enoyl-CoA hydratase [Beijerinckiaceae bacterium RH AL1]|nr:Enoyl-CoA hydratase [Beijerinckiaceae bacterium RH AL8]VVB43119.1 Enoyl-CoA hydratase [Beijerinckiaceae bacterium RH CH11]VVC53670.1 Enoyl-CoA hydratase [Beijerinckiaceae bacterium RH AL1]
MAQIARAHDGKVLTLTIDRPEKKNALTNDMYGQLADALGAARTDDAVRCVVITGAGDTFTAGNDLGDFARVASGDLKQLDRHVHRVLDVLATFEKPVVAAVPGLAVGIGTTMLLHCDLVFLAETALLSTPFVDLALVPEAASSLLLQERIGYARAFSMFALGERVDAARALAWGLANRVVKGDELQATAQAAAQALAARPPGAVVATKALMRDRARLQAQIAREGEAFAGRLASPEAREAFTAFAERRKPDFSKF